MVTILSRPQCVSCNGDLAKAPLKKFHKKVLNIYAYLNLTYQIETQHKTVAAKYIGLHNSFWREK